MGIETNGGEKVSHLKTGLKKLIVIEKRNIINISTIIIELGRKTIFDSSDYIKIENKLEKYYLELRKEDWFLDLTYIDKSLFLVLFYHIGTTKDCVMPNMRKSLRCKDFKKACDDAKNSTLDSIMDVNLLHNILNIIKIGGEK